MGKACGTHVGEEKCYKGFVEKQKTRLGMCKWANIKLDLKEEGWKGVDWIHPPRDKCRTLVNTV
jgi:hypothetical protein